MLRMPWILGNDSSSPSLGLRFIFERSTLFPDDAADGRRTKVEPDPSEYLCHAFVAHRWEKSLQLSDKIPDKVRVTVDRLDSVYQVPFPLFVQSAHPDLQRLQVHEENPSRFFPGSTRGPHGVGGFAFAGSVCSGEGVASEPSPSVHP